MSKMIKNRKTKVKDRGSDDEQDQNSNAMVTTDDLDFDQQNDDDEMKGKQPISNEERIQDQLADQAVIPDSEVSPAAYIFSM